MPSYKEELKMQFWKGFVSGYFLGLFAVITVHWIIA